MTFGSPEELEQRLNLIPSGDMARGFVFTTSLEAVRSEADEAVGERSGRLHLQGNLLPPPFIEGAVLHVCQAVHGSELTVQVRRVAPRENVLTISWA
ncbi:MAG TPA: DUF2378 family protein [Archangium sp.]|nr:DUF2378 family protein [Archangium sp.]